MDGHLSRLIGAHEHRGEERPAEGCSLGASSDH